MPFNILRINVLLTPPAAMFASGLIIFIPSMYSKYSHTYLRWQFGKNALGWRTSYTSQLHSLHPDYLQGFGRLSHLNGLPTHLPNCARRGVLLLPSDVRGSEDTAARGARRLFIYCHPLVYWGLHKTCLLSQKVYGPGCVLGISGSAVFGLSF